MAAVRSSRVSAAGVLVKAFVVVCAALAAGALALAPAALASEPGGVGAAHRAVHTCGAAAPGYAACHALVLVDSAGRPVTTSAAVPGGYRPADLQSAYRLAGLSSGGRTVAVVDAYDDPTAAKDLAVYRATFNLPPVNAPGGPTFRKVNQSGGTHYPRTNAGWATEISLDLDMVSAVCPDCNILLVEASSASFSNLGAAVNHAALVPGVVAISNSYGGPDRGPLAAYNHPGIAVVASTGDNGYGVQAPASFGTVVAAGGTHLVRSQHLPGLDRDGMERGRQRLLGEERQAVVADRGHPVQREGERGRIGRR